MTDTEHTNDPGVLVGVKHPNESRGTQHARFFGIDPGAVLDHARQWFADGTRDLGWLDGQAWVVDESQGPAEPPFPNDPPEQAAQEPPAPLAL